MSKPLIFCTAYITPETKQRYLDWWEYHSQLFSEDADLMMFHDGPTNDVQIRGEWNIQALTPHLGRPSGYNFPGWRRSFRTALEYSFKNGYSAAIHIESDVYIRPSSKDKILDLAKTKGYFCGTTSREVMESAVQIISDPDIAKDISVYYYQPKNLFDPAVSAERQLLHNFNPSFALTGDRVQDVDLRNTNWDVDSWDYYAQLEYSKWAEFIKEKG